MSATFSNQNILTGVEVFGADGEKVGNVAAVYPAFIVVEKGFFFPTDYYIPRSAIASSDADQIFLNVSKDAALESGWNVQPVDLDTAAFMDTSTVAGAAIGDDLVTGTRIAAEEEVRIPIVEEELTATIRSQEAGAVRVAKDVIAEERTLEVPVTEERLRVERRVVDRPATAADLGSFEETVVEVPLRTETVDVRKDARVTEEVVLSKDVVERTERVTDTVRKEKVFIEEEGAVDVNMIEDRGADAGRAM
jgi:uncharacterized protein (TIGR02271 family)